MQKVEQSHDEGSGGKAKEESVDRSDGMPTYKHSTDNGIGTKNPKPKRPHYNVSRSKAKKKSVDRSKGITTYKHSTDYGIYFKMPNPVDGYLVKAKEQDVPQEGVRPGSMDKNVVEEAFLRLRIKHTEYIAKFRKDIEKSNPDQLLKKFEELESNYNCYRRFVAVPLLCEICDVRTSEVEPLLEHYKSSKHKKNLNNPDIKKYIDFDEHLRRVDLMKKIVDMRKKGIYECKLCSLTFSKRDKYVVHKKGKYHESKLYKSYCAFIIANAIQRTNRVLGL